MSLITLNTANAIATVFNSEMAKVQAGTYPGYEYFINQLASILDTHFQNGTLTATSVDLSPVAGTLNFLPITDETSLAVISSRIATYWVGAVGLGIPVNCAAVVSVTNDASKIEQMILDGLTALGGASAPEDNYFEHFVDVIFTAVKTIVWTVSEADATPCSSNYAVTIS